MTTNPNPPGEEPEMPASNDKQTPKKEEVKIGKIEMAILRISVSAPSMNTTTRIINPKIKTPNPDTRRIAHPPKASVLKIMKLSDLRLIRNWRARRALKRCAEVSGEALDRADSLLQEVEKMGMLFRREIEAAAEHRSIGWTDAQADTGPP